MSYGFYYDSTRCMECKVCQVACKDRLNLQKPGPKPRRVTAWEKGVFPEARMQFVSVSCNHCENPACVAACPTGAMFKDEDGIVLHDDEACIKCQSCVAACPYGAPQVAEEYDGLIIKCDSCKALRDAGQVPVCVATCPLRALDFGDMDELVAKYGEGLVSELPMLPSADLTQPNLLIKVREGMAEGEFVEVAI